MIYRLKQRQYKKNPEYTKWRKAIRRRDKFKCAWPGCKCRKKLQVHHIIPWENSPTLRYDMTNGITLCKEHHEYIKGKEAAFAPMLIKIVYGRI